MLKKLVRVIPICVSLSVAGFAQTPATNIAPRYPKPVKITTVEQLMPAAEQVVRRSIKSGPIRPSLELKPGERVLLVTDTDDDHLVVEAFVKAIKMVGGSVDLVKLGYSRNKVLSPIETLRRYGTVPEFTYEGEKTINIHQDLYQFAKAAGYDVLFGSGMGLRGPPFRRDGSQIIEDWEVKPRWVRMPWQKPEMLILESYPEEILTAIEMKVWKKLIAGRRFRLTDLEGTDISWTIDEPFLADKAYKMGWPINTIDTPVFPGHLMFDNVCEVSATQDLEGVVVFSNLTQTAMPTMRLMISGCRVQKVEGGGEYGEVVREVIRKHPDAKVMAGGFNLGTHPKYRRLHPDADHVSKSDFLGWGELRKRAGVVHSGLVSTAPGLNRLNYHNYFSTIWVDGERIVENGHLLALEDPEIRAIAAKYGDPDELLREEYIPEVAGVNAPRR